MRSIQSRGFVTSSFSTVGVLALVASVASSVVACSSSTTPATTPPTDAGATDSGNTDSGTTAALPFQPSNVSLAGIDLTPIGDADITDNCTIQTDGDTDCFPNGYVAQTATQSDGTKVDVVIVKSFRLEAAAHLNVSGGLPLVLISLGDMTLLGTFDAGASTDEGNAGGFTQETSNTKGSGPGGGPAATDAAPGYAGGGGSYCGLGGVGGAESGATAPAATAVYGSPDIRPLAAGSSGGMGAAGGAGAGGGGIQLVSGGTFTMNAGSYINVGGGGGNFGGTATQEASGGGSGGSILIEATTVSIAGILAANGGGGGSCGAGSEDGSDGDPSTTPAAPGGGDSAGGAGSAAGTTAGSPGTDDTTGDCAVGGGGGAGRIRINASTAAAITTTNATISPTIASNCASTGIVLPIGATP